MLLMSFLRKPWLYLTLLFCLCVGLRGYQNFSSFLVSGINGGYYPVQVRSIIEMGRLAYPDMPLVFYLEAGLVLIIRSFTGYALPDLILFVVKLFDAVIPPLLIFPLFLLAKKGWVGLLLSTLGGLSVFLLHGLSGDFAKNATALFFLGLLVLLLHARKRNIVVVVLLFILSSVTHKTGAALGMIFIGIEILARSPLLQRWSRKTILLLTTGGFVLQSLITSSLSHSVFAALLSGFHVVSGKSAFGLFFTWSILLVLAIALRRVYPKIPKEMFLRVVLTFLLTLCLSSLFLGKWYAERLWFISALPLACVTIFCYPYIAGRFRRILLAMIIVFDLVSALYFAVRYKLPLLKYQAYQEIVQNLPFEEGSIVVADHGIDWWVSWATHNKVAQDMVMSKKETASYGRIYYVNYHFEKSLYSWVGSVSIPSSATLTYEGDYIDIYRCSESCY